MKKLFMLARANLRGERGQLIPFMAILIIAALMMNLALVTMFDFMRSFDATADALNTEDANLTITFTADDAALKAALSSLDNVVKMETQDVLCAAMVFPYGGGDMSFNAGVFMRRSDVHSMGQFLMLEQLDENALPEDPIWVPYITKVGGGYALGDPITLTIGQEELTYTIAGFFENTYLNTTNANQYGFLLNDADYAALEKRIDGGALAMQRCVTYRFRVNGDPDLFVPVARRTLQAAAPQAEPRIDISLVAVRSARSFTVTMCSAIFLAFAGIIVVVSLIVARFRIRNSIDENIVNMGAMKALGYSSAQILSGIVLEFGALALLAAALGLALSYAALPVLANALSMQTGVLWQPGFHWLAALTCIVSLPCVVMLASWLSALRIRKLEPIVALRSGMLTHSFRRNVAPLDKGAGSVNLRLALKSALQNARQNVLIAIIMAVTGYSALASLAMYYNISCTPDKFLTLIGGETCDVLVTLAPSATKEDMIALEKEIAEVDGVRAAVGYGACEMSAEGYSMWPYCTTDFANTRNQICYEGRSPIYDNEISIGGGMAKTLGKRVGDSIRLERDGRSVEYLITGLVQTANNRGFDGEMTLAGCNKLNETFRPDSLYVHLEKGADAEKVIDLIESKEDARIAGLLNFEKRIQSQMGVYMKINDIMMAVFMAISLLLVALIFHLVVKSSLVRRKRELGVEKALGYTSRMLMGQLALSYLPSMAIGLALGGVMSAFLLPGMFSAVFSVLSIMRVDFTLPASWIVLFCSGLCLFAYAVTWLASGKIRKLSPCALIREE